MNTEFLTVLREADRPISGQELSDRFHVSRTAIWKWIRQLQEEGYEIEALPSRGYRIVGYPDTIAAEEVESRMQTQRLGHPVKYFESITSTNQYAKKMAEEGAPEGLLVIADEQTAGKGRRGHLWTTPHGTAIAMTLLLRPKIAIDRISMVTLVMGLAIAEACRKLYALPVGIKWPNDAVIGGKKLCGILTEMTTDLSSVGYVVIGVGINVNVKTFPEELKEIATSVSLELGSDQNRAELITETVRLFEEYYGIFEQTQDLSGLKEHYNELLLNKDNIVRVLEPGHEYTGIARGINDRGELLVEREDGSVTEVYAGEVSVRGVYGYV